MTLSARQSVADTAPIDRLQQDGSDNLTHSFAVGSWKFSLQPFGRKPDGDKNGRLANLFERFPQNPDRVIRVGGAVESKIRHRAAPESRGRNTA